MRPMLVIATLAAVALAGCGAGGDTPDSSQVAQYVASGSASSAPSPSGGDANAPKCFTAADVKSAMGIDVVDLTSGMRKYGTFWNCGYVPADATVNWTLTPGSVVA